MSVGTFLFFIIVTLQHSQQQLLWKAKSPLSSSVHVNSKIDFGQDCSGARIYSTNQNINRYVTKVIE